MNITFVTTNINLNDGGGSNFSFHLAASQLCASGHDVSVITLRSSEVGDDAAIPYRIIDLGLDNNKRWTQIEATREAMNRYAKETDVYHIYDSQLAIGAGAYRARGGSVPVVVNLNKYLLFCVNENMMDGACHRECGIAKRWEHNPVSLHRKIKALPMRFYEEWRGFDLVNHVDQFLAVSPSVVQIYADVGFDMQKCMIVPPLIDYERIRSEVDPQPPPPCPDLEGGEGWQVLFAARLVEGKGADLVLDALSMVNAPVHLHIAGDGAQRVALEARSEQLGVTDRVTFHSWVPNEELWTLYRQMHLFVHAGRWPEPGGRTVLEAMTIGVPAIVSDIGGPPWLLNRLGRTFESGNARDLATQIDTCLAQYGESLELARQAQCRAAAFDSRTLVHTLEEAYQRVTQTH